MQRPWHQASLSHAAWVQTQQREARHLFLIGLCIYDKHMKTMLTNRTEGPPGRAPENLLARSLLAKPMHPHECHRHRSWQVVLENA